jgi:hypothetical protein
MDVRAFTGDLLRSLSDIEAFERVAVQTEGPIVSGYAYTDENNFFLRFYLTKLPAQLPLLSLKINSEFGA